MYAARRAGQPVPLSNIIGGDLQMMSDFSISPRIYKGLVDIIRFAKYCRVCVHLPLVLVGVHLDTQVHCVFYGRMCFVVATNIVVREDFLNVI